ncbi:hypothetical protein BOO86_19725 [Mycobacterium sp. CBMA 234]|uniref:hypothetical protein n=1 Tax=Mycolicibacterium sp. CBMA 234 TaxID=1918495 RepID=UPI0012DE5737|nr:hypothetical protein [Mycolicibacterium sp. CBMA 234]MUL66712.1 hypothetical protein [Mycolicibacterium sp. CBMA 234]
MTIQLPGLPPPPDLMNPWFIYKNVSSGQFSLAQQNPGFGWQQWSGPYFTFIDGGRQMNALGVPGWGAF